MNFNETKHLLRYLCFHFPNLSFYLEIDLVYTKSIIRIMANMDFITGFIINLPKIIHFNADQLSLHLSLIKAATNKQIIVFDNTDFSNFDELIKPLSINGLIISDKNKLNNYNKNAQLNIYCLEALYFNEFPAVAGIISDVANIDYQIVVQTLKNSKKQLKFYHTLLHLLNQTSLSTSIKYCLKQQQGFSNQTRLPLTKIDNKLENKLNQVLEKTK
ncbi:hypothetical protein [uncultured Thomasclavelia sp.]|uniref:hypothetical protein n=1 Tax=uncultured Thomasclavelia sp. TaxID=3025759 RepID=UPI0025D5FF62|nr:hypothetical protein [uncultured Thomasclavelia sp.]